VNTTCRNYGGVRTPRTLMDRRHCLGDP